MLRRVALAAAVAVSASTHAGELSLVSCAPLSYPPEALRYEIEGTTQIELTVGAGGGALAPRVVQSSGSAILDRASLAMLASCKFAAQDSAGASVASLAVPWKLPDGARADIAPSVIADSCRRGYKVLELVSPDSPRRNLSVRVQVWQDGRAFTPRVEQSSGEALADKEAQEVAESCDYVPGRRGAQPVKSAVLLAFALNRTAIGDDKVRALYDRLAAQMMQGNDYKVRHILVSAESAAIAILADLRAGAQFGAIARAQSLDKPSAKVDGALGWLRPTDTVQEFSRAVALHGKTGLLPAPVHTAFGWHVIEIEASRPGVVPPYDEEARRILKERLIGEREVIVQQPPPLRR